ncbi:MAG: glycerol kinase GlpK [Oleiphilaceae bacterium]|nr:glycerol kinase GlpK [Oleiphilaceae bacterium]
MEAILAIDQGTTSSRAIIFDKLGQRVASAQQEFRQYFPDDGWVEHDAAEIWSSTLAVCREALASAGLEARELSAIGITNQRETSILWDRVSGDPVHKAIVWQDRRTAPLCEQLRRRGSESLVVERTGLVLDPYFSATKIAWMLDNVSGLRERAERGELAFGTVDTWLLWCLTQGRVHATDASNASRTALFDIHRQCWDEDLLDLFNIPASLLPEVKDSAADFGQTAPALLGSAVSICGMAGDQQAALFGQACFERGMAKSTYGTGCFLMLNTGEAAIRSENRLLTTVAYRLNGRVSYAMEGSIFVAGAAIQWLRDGLGLIEKAADSESLARQVDRHNSVYLVPAFTGLGAPYWDPHARGAIIGLTRDTGIAEIVTAGLQSVCYQTKDLVRAIQNDGAPLATLRVDGGMVVNDWLMQFLADILNVDVDRPEITETTALGAAYLAGLQSGVFSDLDEIARQWQRNRRFSPEMPPRAREKAYQGWLDAVDRVTHRR